MQTVYERLIVADVTACRRGDDRLFVVHACKSPCHQNAVGYKGSLLKTHPNYLSLKQGSDLYLNIIDPPVPLFPNDLFTTFFAFAGPAWNEGRTLLIHCNQGESRAPSLALLFLAKQLKVISNDSYAQARAEFSAMYPRYAPGKGIETYLRDNWRSLDPS